MAACVKIYGDLPCDRGEIMRYAAIKNPAPQTDALLDGCLEETKGVFSCKACFAEFPLEIKGQTVDFGFAETRSKDLAARLSGCDSAIIFAATAGVGIDRLIARYSVLSPSKAVMFQAIGTEKVESLADALCGDLERDCRTAGKTLTARFSAGYGDLPLAFQRDIFAALDCSKRIGVMLGESLVMSPSKSVTAIVGIRNGKNKSERSGSAACGKKRWVCAACGRKDCDYRSGK